VCFRSSPLSPPASATKIGTARSLIQVADDKIGEVIELLEGRVAGCGVQVA